MDAHTDRRPNKAVSLAIVVLELCASTSVFPQLPLESQAKVNLFLCVSKVVAYVYVRFA